MSLTAGKQLLLSSPAGGYQVSRSLRFNSADSAYLSRVVSSAGNRKLWTLSMWVKRGTLTDGALFHAPTTTSGTAHTWCNFSGDTLQIYDYTGSSYNFLRQTAQVFRDPSAWYHLVFTVDSDNATAANRARIYVNGTEVTTWTSTSTAAAGFSTAWNNAVTHQISSQSQYFNGYLAEIHFIDGQALTPSSFAETNATTGQWIPKLYSGSYGTNGFKLNFSDNSAATAAALGKDTSGNSNNWTPNNLSVTAGAGNDSLVDTPTSYGTDTGVGGEVRGNYATLNPLVYASGATFSNGNLEATFSASDVVGTHLLDTGKYYWEITCGTITTSPSVDAYYGLIQPYSYSGARNWGAANVRTWRNGGTLYGNGSTGTVTSYTTGDVLGFAYDGSTGNLYVAKNGTWQNSANPASGTGAVFTGIAANTFVPGFSVNASSSITANFGQRPFAYTAPSGFKALCDTNLPTPVVAKPSEVMDVKLYTGNGSTQTISGLGFSPDLVWLKARSIAYSHQLYDPIRGTTNALVSNTTAAEAVYSGGLTAFNSNGFSIGNDGGINNNNDTFVAWCWDAGSTTVTNTAGSITSSVRANASAGFSIVSYTSVGTSTSLDTVGHGLGVSPSLAFIKNRDLSDSWWVYSSLFSDPTKDYLVLNSTAAKATFTPTSYSASSTTIGVRQGLVASSAGQKIIIYAFAPVAGYSSFGSYVGNGSASDGPFVFTGFRPAFVMLKTSSAAGDDWYLYDYKREAEYNPTTKPLFPNGSYAEQPDSRPVDLLSNGFKIRNQYWFNANGATVIYCAFAQNPFQYARAR